MRNCDGCRFCCWSFNVDDAVNKSSLHNCKYECENGCNVFGEEERPKSCISFFCPYLLEEDIYRPDEFYEILKIMNGDIGNYIPFVPSRLSKDEVVVLIKETNSIPATIVINGVWDNVIMPLKRNEDDSWMVTTELVSKWEHIYNKNNLLIKTFIGKFQ